MYSFFTGSVQSWLAVAAATLSPLIALIVVFEGAGWCSGGGSSVGAGAHAPLEGAGM